jgi:hypothetical protein
MTPRFFGATRRTPSGPQTRAWARQARAFVAAAGVVSAVACGNTLVPNLDSPNVNASTQAGIQLLTTGAFAAPRTQFEIQNFVNAMSSFARDMGIFTASDQEFITMWLGDGVPVSSSRFFGTVVWNNEFRTAASINKILTAIPTVIPAYSASDAAHLAGALNTLKALTFMMLAETRDTVGVPVYNLSGTPQAQAPILCNKDVWKYIAALLDSANTQLNVAPAATPLPVILPAGFANVSATAGPSTAAGSFASFNRALAARAYLQLAYGIARSTAGTAPGPTTAGAPDVASLNSALAAVTASALYNPGALVPQSAGDFSPVSDPTLVFWNFSGSSGDSPSPLNNDASTMRILNEFVTDVASEIDTTAAAGDKRWVSKITINPFPAQQAAYAVVSSGFLVGFIGTATSPVPITRNEELVLTHAQIELGMGNIGATWADINAVRTAVGGSPAKAPTADYVSTRDALLREIRISTLLEFSEDRAIAIRDYGLQAAADTTWGAADTHATLLPLPIGEVDGRSGHVTPSCP